MLNSGYPNTGIWTTDVKIMTKCCDFDCIFSFQWVPPYIYVYTVDMVNYIESTYTKNMKLIGMPCRTDETWCNMNLGQNSVHTGKHSFTAMTSNEMLWLNPSTCSWIPNSKPFGGFGMCCWTEVFIAWLAPMGGLQSSNSNLCCFNHHSGWINSSLCLAKPEVLLLGVPRCHCEIHRNPSKSTSIHLNPSKSTWIPSFFPCAMAKTC